MLSLEETFEYISNLKLNLKNNNHNNNSNVIDNKILQDLNNFFQKKFSEVEEIFKQLDNKGLKELFNHSELNLYKENEVIFKKEEDCNKYYFLIYGDVTIYSENKSENNAKLLKTISGGVVFGHKVKDKFQYFAYSKSVQVLILSINKEEFNKIIDEFKLRNSNFKTNFLKKYIPYLRLSGEDNINKVKDRFMKMIYFKGSKINIDGEYDDYIYLIISGECQALKTIKKVNNLNELLNNKGVLDKTHIVLDVYSKFYIFLKYNNSYLITIK